MIDQSTNKKQGIYSLALSSPFYYLKSDKIESVIKYGNRSFYSKFKRVDNPPSLKEISRDIRLNSSRIYLPVYTNNISNRLIFINSLDAYEVFVSTFKQLLAYLKLDYKIYIDRDNVQVHIFVDKQSIKSLYNLGKEISNILESKLPKSWQIYPDIEIPAEKNIYPLPIDEYIN